MKYANTDEIEWFASELVRLGFHPRSTDAYCRELDGFLSQCPGFEEWGAALAAERVEEHIAAAPPAYDHPILQAALRKWVLLRFEIDLRKHRAKRSDYASSPEIDAEVDALSRRLELDNLAESSIERMRSTVSMFLGWLFPDGRVDLREVCASSAEEYMAAEKAHLSNGGRSTEMGRLSRYLALVAERTGAADCTPLLKPPSWKNEEPPRMTWDDEMKALLAPPPSRCRHQHAKARAAIALMGNLGLRCCEAAALTLDDIDFRAATVTVAASKGEAARKVPLDAQTGALLAAYLTEARPRSSSRAVFLRGKGRHAGEPVTTEQLRQCVRYHARVLGIGNFATHMLRRRTVTKLVAAGNEPKVVADMVGHNDVQTTMTYLRLDVDSIRLAAAPWPGGLHD